MWATNQPERPLVNSVRDPIKQFLPERGLQALPLSYNWDCKNAVVFVFDGDLDAFRKFLLDKRSDSLEVRDFSEHASVRGKLDMMISGSGYAFIELFAMHGRGRHQCFCKLLRM